MHDYFNDSPIETAEDDRYGITPFAKSIAKSILSIKQPIGTTIALNGPWGSGKSSAVNLIRTALQEADDDKLVITEFKCWWYRGEEALSLAFLQNLHTVLKDSLGDKVKDFIPKLARNLLQAGPVIGQAVSLASGEPLGTAISSGTKFLSTFFPEGAIVEKTFRKLAKILEDQDRRCLVIIDDIDRLSPDEALGVFRLVKSVGRLPNVMYLLVFERELAEKMVQQRYPSEGPQFLEKIIQAGFELPAPLQTDLNDAVLASVSEICGSPNEAQIGRIMNIFYDVIVPYIMAPRHVARFRNAISVTWPAIANEVNLADFIALETLRLYEPKLFKAIRLRKSEVCGTRRQGDPDQRDNARFDTFLRDVPESQHELAKLALQRLFPKLESMVYGAEWVTEWAAGATLFCVRRLGLDNPFRAVLGILPDRPRLGGIQSTRRSPPTGHIRWCFLARFYEVESQFERGKDQPQFRFLNDILIMKSRFELGSSIARRGSAHAVHRVTKTGGRKYE